MKATIVDLRYKMKNILKALNRNEVVRILYHGKERALLLPTKQKGDKKVQDHPFFGMHKSKTKKESVAQEMERLRGKRYHDL
jgi:hypothetical protein